MKFSSTLADAFFLFSKVSLFSLKIPINLHASLNSFFLFLSPLMARLNNSCSFAKYLGVFKSSKRIEKVVYFQS